MKDALMVALAAAALMMAAPGVSHAQDARPDGFGLGLGQGTGVSGISGKVHTGDTAFQGVIGNWWGGWGVHTRRGYRRYRTGGLGFSGDILFNMPSIHDAGAVTIAWNLGGGAAVGVHPDWMALRGQFVAGLEFLFPEVPLDVVLELRPSVRFVPFDLFPRFSAGGHIRFYIQ